MAQPVDSVRNFLENVIHTVRIDIRKINDSLTAVGQDCHCHRENGLEGFPFREQSGRPRDRENTRRTTPYRAFSREIWSSQ